MTDAPLARSAEPRRRRPGYILIVVLGITAVIVSLGLAFINANSTVIPEAANRYRAARARYIAESGVQAGIHYLLYPPATVTDGDYWRGATNISVDDTTDYVDVAVQQDPSDVHQFQITATGVAHDFDGIRLAGKHKITATVLRPPEPKWRVPFALYSGAYLDVPTTAEVQGDLHAESDIVGYGWCNGAISATGSIDWQGTGPPTSITPLAPSVASPPVDPSLYTSYVHKGNTYSARNWPYNDIYWNEAQNLNGQDWSTTNPGRIIKPPVGSLLLRDMVRLSGTLVVEGNLLISGNGIQVNSVDGYPALVVTGDIRFASDSSDIVIDGSVLCGGRIDDRGRPVSLEITGACMVHGSNPLNSSGAMDTFRFVWSPTRSVFWDLASTARHEPMTILSWQEN